MALTKRCVSLTRSATGSAWLLGEDYPRLLAQPLDEVRRRLGVGRPERYFALDQGHREDPAALVRAS